MLRKCLIISLVFVIIAHIQGCGDRLNQRFGQVSGVVTLDGKALPEVDVQFIPEIKVGYAPPGVGITDEKGNYKAFCNIISQSRANTYKKKGVIAGWNKVVIQDYKMHAEHLPPPGRVPKIYTDPETTPFRFKIKEGQSQTIDLKLKSR